MTLHGVPTNAELEANAPDTLFEAVRNWLARHPTPRAARHSHQGRKEWLDWAATNLINDPEIRGACKKESADEGDPDWLYSEANGALYGPSDNPRLRQPVATEVDPKWGHLIANTMNAKERNAATEQGH